MARSRFIYTLGQVAGMISDGSEDGTKGLTENGIEELQSLLADIRTWNGGIREFLIDKQCDPVINDRIMAVEMKRGL